MPIEVEDKVELYKIGNLLAKLKLDMHKLINEHLDRTIAAIMSDAEFLNDFPEKTTEKTTEKILEALRTDPYLSNKELAGLCGITVDGVYYNIKKLKNTGRLKRIGADNGGYWEVLD